MNEKQGNIVIQNKDGLAEIVERAIAQLPEGFLPCFDGQVYSVDYVPNQNLVRIACSRKFDFALPEDARWEKQKANLFYYRGRNYQIIFWD